MGEWGDRLLAQLTGVRSWPPRHVRRAWDYAERWAAFRENDREVLRVIAGWTDKDRRYRVDPLPQKIGEAFGALLFQKPPVWTPAADADQDVQSELLANLQLVPRLPREEVNVSSEGETWWRLYIDRELADHPLISWHSRIGVIPYFVADQLRAVAFITSYRDYGTRDTRYRHLEVHDGATVDNVLFRGTRHALGREVALDSIPDTATLDQRWEHGLPSMPSGRVPNRIGERIDRGTSDLDGIDDFLLDLNEAVSIAAENARLTGKQRMMVPRSAVDQSGNLPAGREVIVLDVDPDAMPGEGGSNSGGPYRVLAYEFDAAALIAHQEHLARTALTRVGITPQFVGQQTGAEGDAATGVALRLRLIPSTQAGDAKGTWWDPELRRMVWLGGIMDSRSTDDGGFGRRWAEAETAPTVERAMTMPEDVSEKSLRLGTLRSSNLLSIESGLRELYPGRDDQWYAEERGRIVADVQDLRGATTPLFGP